MSMLDVLRAPTTLFLGLVLFCWMALVPVTASAQTGGGETALLIHGGAGGMSEDEMSEARQKTYKEALRAALQNGNEVLQDGGSALDAIEAVITTMESDTLFNAGRGAVLTNQNTAELDAAVMDGETRNAGALTGVQTVKHPIRLARTIMTESEHVMMAQEGAETFAEEHGLELVENDYFITDRRRSGAGDDAHVEETAAEKFGTVGAVALDQEGNLAAGTSTGGISNKRFGRIGDSPIVGAGTYASNESVAVSATGQGEFYIRSVAAHNVASRVRFGDASIQEAAQAAVDEAEALGGVGGLIVLDPEGNMATPFTTSGMFRAYVDTDGNTAVRIFESSDTDE
ncbi:MAG: isoaspartyl peptidase/L-asparaginase family protein [Salinivenus sp.]